MKERGLLRTKENSRKVAQAPHTPSSLRHAPPESARSHERDSGTSHALRRLRLLRSPRLRVSVSLTLAAALYRLWLLR